ncbi:MAG: hypothetical protein SPK92_02395 [Bacilli bacterium]|nr:hypothetical protein [Bacilli bacterium]MDD7549541.1 hypothetical protein [Bacilli bacterium]MDY5745202.1 hypothetical protein [Bacilli bacterium]
MRKIILIGGDLASGKSTYSTYLSSRFNLTSINKDTLKEIAGDVIHVETREENKKLSVLAFNYIKYFLTQEKGNLIIESNFKEHEIEEIKELTKNDAVLSIRLIGDYSFLHERFLSRLNNNRHYVHKSIDLSSLEDFKKVQDELRKVEYPSKTITFEVSKDVFPQDDIYLNKEIENFLKN